jgi:nitroimidazol reductase NimA-like FMN-containing flavoprotein (pyridoxamine 5'-phosphate oxidase superfamily)
MDTRPTFAVTPRTKVQRRPDRASYDRALAYSILDEALYVSVAFDMGDGPCVIPMAFARLGEHLVLHGASTSRLQRALAGGRRVCVCATLVDGIVLSRSAMHHSLNYRSVVVFGTPVEVVAEAEKREALARLVDHVVPGRSEATRAPNQIELKATRVFRLPLVEVSVKQRSGGPVEDEADLELPYWAGVIPVELSALQPVSDEHHVPLVAVPDTVVHYDRRAMVASDSGSANES